MEKITKERAALEFEYKLKKEEFFKSLLEYLSKKAPELANKSTIDYLKRVPTIVKKYDLLLVFAHDNELEAEADVDWEQGTPEEAALIKAKDDLYKMSIEAFDVAKTEKEHVLSIKLLALLSRQKGDQIRRYKKIFLEALQAILIGSNLAVPKRLRLLLGKKEPETKSEVKFDIGEFKNSLEKRKGKIVDEVIATGVHPQIATRRVDVSEKKVAGMFADLETEIAEQASAYLREFPEDPAKYVDLLLEVRDGKLPVPL
ncbi:MAG: hypothetical protein HY983_03155 [Candidatus Magasanikbacteria bacterium]|nr:hypothetical protein [Candidatus Magasanikbacteria bacterium]